MSQQIQAPEAAPAGIEAAAVAELAELATALGIEVDWLDQAGDPQRVGEATLRAVLSALGVPAGDGTEVRAALDRLGEQEQTRLLPPHVIAREGEPVALTVHAPVNRAVTVTLTLENGTRRRLRLPEPARTQTVSGTEFAEYRLTLPTRLPCGYHSVSASVRGPKGHQAGCPLVVAPARLAAPAGGRRVFGLAAQLYSVRSAHSFGLGDLGDLGEIAAWAGAGHGADFVAVNPLCAAAPQTPREDSPYLPTTKRYSDPSYLGVQVIPEYARLAPDLRSRVDALAASVAPDTATVPADVLDDPGGVAAGVGLLDRDAAWAAKEAALRVVFASGLSPGRRALLDRFIESGGADLARWALWWVLAQLHGPDSRSWPTELRHPDAPAVQQAAGDHAAEVAFQLWIQWCLAEQLDAATRVAADAGMVVGIIHDLPIGVHAGGADTWSLPGLFAEGMSVGAPPDMFNQQGQDWSAPPLRPDKLTGAGLWTFRDQVRAILRHAGGVRIDHVLGLFRLWWVPAGLGSAAGAYVRYDHEALISVLVLEATRAGAVVVGEDLGTVAPWVQEYLADRGVLGTSILWFERDDSGQPKVTEAWRTQTMGSVTVHDLPPTPGYLDGEHIRLRAGLGQLTRDVAVEQEEDEADRARWLEVLRAGGFLGDHAQVTGPAAAHPTGEPPDIDDSEELVLALHRYLAATPVALLAVGLPDAVGDRRVQNLPGTSTEYPNWRLPLTGPDGRPLLLADVENGPRAGRLLDTVAAALDGGPGTRKVS